MSLRRQPSPTEVPMRLIGLTVILTVSFVFALLVIQVQGRT